MLNDNLPLLSRRRLAAVFFALLVMSMATTFVALRRTARLRPRASIASDLFATTPLDTPADSQWELPASDDATNEIKFLANAAFVRRRESISWDERVREYLQTHSQPKYIVHGVTFEELHAQSPSARLFHSAHHKSHKHDQLPGKNSIDDAGTDDNDTDDDTTPHNAMRQRAGAGAHAAAMFANIGASTEASMSAVPFFDITARFAPTQLYSLFVSQPQLSPEERSALTVKLFDLFPPEPVLTRWDTCAVVGSAPNPETKLKGGKLGKQIDAHSAVFRLNQDRVKGWEEDVGARTTIRLFAGGKKPIEAISAMSRYIVSQRKLANPAHAVNLTMLEDDALALVSLPGLPDDVDRTVLYLTSLAVESYAALRSVLRRAKPRLQRAFARKFRFFDPQRYHSLACSEVLEGVLRREFASSQCDELSEYFLATIVALNHCGKVTVFGAESVQAVLASDNSAFQIDTGSGSDEALFPQGQAGKVVDNGPLGTWTDERSGSGSGRLQGGGTPPPSAAVRVANCPAFLPSQQQQQQSTVPAKSCWELEQVWLKYIHASNRLSLVPGSLSDTLITAQKDAAVKRHQTLLAQLEEIAKKVSQHDAESTAAAFLGFQRLLGSALYKEATKAMHFDVAETYGALPTAPFLSLLEVPVASRNTRPMNHLAQILPPFSGRALWGRCAVVGSAFFLRQTRWASVIGAHDTVIRVGWSPVVGFSAAVGKRTDIRVVDSLRGLTPAGVKAGSTSAQIAASHVDARGKILYVGDVTELDAVLQPLFQTNASGLAGHELLLRTLPRLLVAGEHVEQMLRASRLNGPLRHEWSNTSMSHCLEKGMSSNAAIATLLAVANCDMVDIYGLPVSQQVVPGKPMPRYFEASGVDMDDAEQQADCDVLEAQTREEMAKHLHNFRVHVPEFVVEQIASGVRGWEMLNVSRSDASDEGAGAGLGVW